MLILKINLIFFNIFLNKNHFKKITNTPVTYLPEPVKHRTLTNKVVESFRTSSLCSNLLGLQAFHVSLATSHYKVMFH